MTPSKRRLTVAIVGRPNVGKSTLFNRLFGRKRALVHDFPGVTRDRLVEELDWMVGGKTIPVRLIDTGGLGGDRFVDEIKEQVALALAEADVAICLFDGQAGLLPADEVLVRELKKSLGKAKKSLPIIAVVNKVDAEVHEGMIAEFVSLGLDPVLTVSAEHGRGIDDLQEAIVALQPEVAESESDAVEGQWKNSESESSTSSSSSSTDTDTGELTDTDSDSVPARQRRTGPPRIAIVGRPNVGKSTLTNALLGKRRMITSPIAGTTVDAVDSPVELNGKQYVLIDTAGIRRKNKTEQGVEVLSVVQAKKALERCDVAILLLDGEQGLTDQDEKIGGLIEDMGCGVILALNKWDTQRGKKDFTREDAGEIIRKKIAYLRYAPLLFLSAKEGKGFKDLGDLIEEILHQRKIRIPTGEITKWVKNEAPIHNPKGAKFYVVQQTGRFPPTFVCHVNDPDRVHFSLRRHLVNGIRERWGFMGSPVRMNFIRAHGGKE